VKPVRILLVSTYELGHQPLHVASPAARLVKAGHDVRCLDLAVEPWDDSLLGWAEALALSVPMHTAMRLAMRVAAAARLSRPDLPLCFYGLYAPVARARTVRGLGARVIAGEYEPALVRWADALDAGPTSGGDALAGDVVDLGRHRFVLPWRAGLPLLERYARFVDADGERLVGYVEASHGCAHRCRHCPVPVVYDGRIRIVEEDIVLEDVAQLIAMGARHVTFGDPDFLNGVHHSLRVVRALHAAFPDVTFDCTTKVEHILAQADVWPALAQAGCRFVVSAFESTNDAILGRLDKGHTVADESRAVALLRSAGIEVRPSWLPFTPWTSPADIGDLLAFVAQHDLVANVDPVQYTIRLLLPDGSLLLAHPDLAPHLGPYDPEGLSWSWSAADPKADELQAELAELVERHVAAGLDPTETFAAVQTAVRACGVDAKAAEDRRPAVAPGPPGVRPHLTEPWFCCSEPTALQLQPLPR
jgi:radical SAM superfamily enzyme YgiQ (UPF0313 family)